MKKFTLLFLCLFSTQIFGQNYQATLAGKRLILEGATCAGMEFNGTATLANMRTEMVCQMNEKDIDNWRVTWINDEVFFLTEIDRLNETSPPRNFIYQIISLKGKKLVVKDYWTGWNNFKTETQTYLIKNP